MDFTNEDFMRRCIQLAELAADTAAPNPMVGAVLVHKGKIIGEGFHRRAGEAHAELNAIENVSVKNRSLIPAATLYVNLEPCNHQGKTPPCTERIIAEGIKRVVVGCTDKNRTVTGHGIEKLRSTGIEVVENILREECEWLNRRFFTFHAKQRPYIILKWAQTADGFISGGDGKSVSISLEISKRLVHKWRTEEQAILVGTRTIELDNPQLNTRFFPGRNPLRVVPDRTLRLDKNCTILTDGNPTLIFTEQKKVPTYPNVEYIKIRFDAMQLDTMLSALHKKNILSVLVEGGTKILQSFIDRKLWDEARIITSSRFFGEELKAPLIKGEIKNHENLSVDSITILKPEA